MKKGILIFCSLLINCSLLTAAPLYLKSDSSMMDIQGSYGRGTDKSTSFHAGDIHLNCNQQWGLGVIVEHNTLFKNTSDLKFKSSVTPYVSLHFASKKSPAELSCALGYSFAKTINNSYNNTRQGFMLDITAYKSVEFKDFLTVMPLLGISYSENALLSSDYTDINYGKEMIDTYLGCSFGGTLLDTFCYIKPILHYLPSTVNDERNLVYQVAIGFMFDVANPTTIKKATGAATDISVESIKSALRSELKTSLKTELAPAKEVAPTAEKEPRILKIKR